MVNYRLELPMAMMMITSECAVDIFTFLFVDEKAVTHASFEAREMTRLTRLDRLPAANRS